MSLLRSIILIALLSLMAVPAKAQFSLPDDTVLCPGQTHFIPSGFKSISSSTVITLADDQFSGVIPIGFSFDFYGQTYTDLVISSNNYVTFDLTVAGGISGWQILQNIPNATNAQPNSIMCPWQDIHPGIGGVVEYGIAGTAPNRVFTISFCQIPMFSCTGDLFTNQILLFEGSNRIETHIKDKPLCTTWNGGVAIHGLQNATGTAADVVPGRNFNDPTWTTTNEGFAFVPNAAGSSYNVQPVAYDPSVFDDIEWRDQNGMLVHTGDSLPANFPSNSINTITVESNICGGAIYSDTIVIFTPGLDAWEIAPSCANSNTGIVYIDLFDNNPYRYNCFLVDRTDSIVWASGVQTDGDTAYGIGGGTYAVVVTDTNSCLLMDSVTISTVPDVTAQIVQPADTFYDSTLVSQTFFHSSPGADSYLWTSDGRTSTLQQGVFTFDTCGNYYISLEVELNGCTDSTGIWYVVKCYVPEPPIPPVIPDTATLIMPNVFTPNGDFQNDYFNAVQPTPDSLATFEGIIFNRYGSEIYRWSDWRTPEAGWDGTFNGAKVADGAYFYIVRANDYAGQSIELQGVVHLSSGGVN